MIDFADQIKSSVTMREVAERYGLQINRMSKAICPFHNDSKPSMHIYGGKRGWYCFVCNQGGDVIDFVQRYFNLSFRDAALKLNEDFNLNLPIKAALSEADRIEAEKLAAQKREAQHQHEMLMKRLLTAYHAAWDRWKMLDDIKRLQAPQTPLDDLTAEYIYACQHIDEAWEEAVDAELKLRWCSQTA